MVAAAVPSSVIPTLAFMADVYRLSRQGGAESPRFRAYAAAAGQRVPIGGYNPMTGQSVLGHPPIPGHIRAVAWTAALPRLAVARLCLRI